MSDALTPENLAAQLPLGKGVEVVAADPCGLVALHKPIAVRSQPAPDHRKGENLLKGKTYDEDRRCYQDFPEGTPWNEIFLLHRLDSATSGVILIALNETVAKAVQQAFEKGRVQKHYHAIVQGRPSPVPTIWNDRIDRQRQFGKLRVHTERGLPVRTEHKFIRGDLNNLHVALIELKPISGRTHQLRVQCKKHQCPILGDKTYGDFKWNHQLRRQGVPDRMFLHASSIQCRFILQDGPIDFRAEVPLPEAFDLVLTRNANLRKAEARPKLSPNEQLRKEREQRLKQLSHRPDPMKAHQQAKSRRRGPGGKPSGRGHRPH